MTPSVFERTIMFSRNECYRIALFSTKVCQHEKRVMDIYMGQRITAPRRKKEEAVAADSAVVAAK